MEAEIQAGPSTRPEATGKRRSVLPPKPPVDLAGELAALKERLGGLDGLDMTEVSSARPDEDEWTRRLERLRVADRPAATQRAGGEGEDTGKGSGSPVQPISDLDKRLARLEAAVGSDESTVSPFRLAVIVICSLGPIY